MESSAVLRVQATNSDRCYSRRAPFGPPPNGVEDGAFAAHHDGREKGRPRSVRHSLPQPLAETLGVQRPSKWRGNAEAPPNSVRRPSEVCETAMTEAWWPRGGQKLRGEWRLNFGGWGDLEIGLC
ncbi:hypothetical protein CXB51_018144 [Gossypium anomalum]|uniref:Uncharacterized protein n=1 Tax=Gossypium anomalum TaxID=47600 RepID=A0A8J5YRR4_9ROSI|nr:hypothetical protein CXB51_018144 [Gossypium anomalum]